MGESVASLRAGEARQQREKKSADCTPVEIGGPGAWIPCKKLAMVGHCRALGDKIHLWPKARPSAFTGRRSNPLVARALVCRMTAVSFLHRMTSSSSAKPPRSNSRAATAAPPVAESYEAALEELEQLVSQLDAGQLPLDQLLSRYQRGAELLAFCRSRLEAVENQIQQLEGGELKPWSAS